MAASKQLADMQQELVKQMFGFWSAMAGAAAPWMGPAAAAAGNDDKRFAGEAWRNDPRFDLIKRTYLAYAGFWQQAVESAPIDEQAKAKLRYDVRQFLDAVSPANFFATNPEAMQLALETGGQSVVQGMGLFFEDLAKGRISTTDESAFTVGRNLAASPGAVIYENDLIQLIQYAPLTPQVHARPLVMIPPCINKYYIMDLQPENSLVRYAVGAGAHGVHGVMAQHRRRDGPPDLGRLPGAGRHEGDRRGARDHPIRPGEHAGLLHRRHAARLRDGGDEREREGRGCEHDLAHDDAGFHRHRRDRRAGKRAKRGQARGRYRRRAD